MKQIEVIHENGDTSDDQLEKIACLILHRFSVHDDHEALDDTLEDFDAAIEQSRWGAAPNADDSFANVLISRLSEMR